MRPKSSTPGYFCNNPVNIPSFENLTKTLLINGQWYFNEKWALVAEPKLKTWKQIFRLSVSALPPEVTSGMSVLFYIYESILKDGLLTDLLTRMSRSCSFLLLFASCVASILFALAWLQSRFIFIQFNSIYLYPRYCLGQAMDYPWADLERKLLFWSEELPEDRSQVVDGYEVCLPNLQMLSKTYYWNPL